MKQNNKKIETSFITHSLFSIILLCITLTECRANDSYRWLPPIDAPTTKTPSTYSQAYPPKASPSFSQPASKAPNQNPTSEEEDHSTFSSAFTDILRGSLRGHSLTLPKRINAEIEPNTDNEAVKRVCGHTDYPDICLTTITPFLGQNYDVMNILEASIKACAYQLKFTIAKVKRHTDTSQELASALTDCRDQYASAMENLQRAMAAIPSRDLGTITVTLSAVMADVSTCESSFEDLKSPSSMVNSEGLVTITANNCLSIASMIPY